MQPVTPTVSRIRILLLNTKVQAAKAQKVQVEKGSCMNSIPQRKYVS